MASTPLCGALPCAILPLMTMWKRSLFALSMPGLQIVYAVIRGAGRHHLRRRVQAENGRRFRIFHHALRHHQLRAPVAFEGRGHRLLCGLEDEFNAAFDQISVFGQQFRHAKRASRVDIVSAGVHDARILRAIRRAAQFLDRQRVHVRTHRNAGAILRTFEHGDDAVLRNAGLDVGEAEFLQPVGDEFCRADLLVWQFGMHVNVPADFDEFRKHLPDALLEDSVTIFAGEG